MSHTVMPMGVHNPDIWRYAYLKLVSHFHYSMEVVQMVQAVHSCERWRSALDKWVETHDQPEVPKDVQDVLLSGEMWSHVETCDDCYEQYWVASAKIKVTEAAREDQACETAVGRMIDWIRQQETASRSST